MSSYHGTYGSGRSSENIFRTSFIEGVGTFLLVFVGAIVVVTVTLVMSGAPAMIGVIAAAFAFGLTLRALVNGLGSRSGCHLNPAVTIALAAHGYFPKKYVLPYMIGQFSGAMLASLTIWLLIGEKARSIAVLGATQPADGLSLWRVFGFEVLATFFLMLAITWAGNDDSVPVSVSGETVGAVLTVGILAIGYWTGGALNPARALGPMVVSDHMSAWYVYLAGPVVGALLGVRTYQLMRKGEEPSEAEDE